VLCLQDTTELDFNGQDIKGLGSLSYDAQRGMYLHRCAFFRALADLVRRQISLNNFGARG